MSGEMAELHEMICPSCQATIRSRLADMADRAELERLRDERADLLHSLRESHDEQERMARSLRWLRTRDKKAAAVVQAWALMLRLPESLAASAELSGSLDELTRAHDADADSRERDR